MINAKFFWREILIGVLIIFLCWLGCDRKPVQIVPGITEVVRVDTVIQIDSIRLPSPTVREWRKVFVPVHDTVYTIVDGIRVDTFYTKDTAWLYTDVPVNQYRDSFPVPYNYLHYDISTIGWIDSISFDFRALPVQNESRWKWVAGILLGPQNLAPGIGGNFGKTGVMYFYDIPRSNHMIGLTYRFSDR